MDDNSKHKVRHSQMSVSDEYADDNESCEDSVWRLFLLLALLDEAIFFSLNNASEISSFYCWNQFEGRKTFFLVRFFSDFNLFKSC